MAVFSSKDFFTFVTKLTAQKMGTETARQRRELTKPIPQLKNNSWICIFSVSAPRQIVLENEL